MIEYFLLGISLGISIGPASLESIRRGLLHGFKAGFQVALGASFADFFYLSLVFFGLSPFLSSGSIALGLWLLGAGVLFYIAFKNLREFFSKVEIPKKAQKGNGLVAGFMLAGLSPITITFWIALYGSILNTVGHGIDAFAGGLLALLGALSVMAVICAALHWGKRFVNEKSLRWVSLMAAVLLGGFGILFAYRALSML